MKNNIAFLALFFLNLSLFALSAKTFDEKKLLKQLEIVEISSEVLSLSHDVLQANFEDPIIELKSLIISLERVESLIVQTDFNLDNIPNKYAEGPPGSGIEPGTDPSVIKDPVVRKKYEALILQNNQKIKVYGEQIQLNHRKVSLLNCLSSFAANHVGDPNFNQYFELVKKSNLQKDTLKQIISDFSVKKGK